MNFKNALTAILLSAVSTAVRASPIEHASRSGLDVWIPRILTPNANTVWTVGTDQSVTWDTSNAPKIISNGAAVYLRHTGLFLAKGFDLRGGIVNVTVPKVAPGSYQITLFGDSGNFSPFFQIIAA